VTAVVVSIPFVAFIKEEFNRTDTDNNNNEDYQRKSDKERD